MEPRTAGAAHWTNRWIRGGFALTLVIFAAIAVSAYLGMNAYILMLGTTLYFALIIGLFLFMNRQIRNRRAAADLLRLGEQRLQTVVNSIQEGITFSDAEGRFEVFNHRMTEITGYTAEEANRAGDFIRLICPDHDDHQRALDTLNLVLEHPGPQVSDTWITTKSGERKLLRVSSRMVEGTAQKMLLTTYGDITGQNRLEQALRESEEKLHLVFEYAQDGINIFEEAADHKKRRLVECNPRFAELAGRSREELLAAGITKGMTVSLSGENEASVEGGIAFHGSFSWIRPDGRDNIIEYTAMPIEMRGKKYTIGIDRDVTDARKADQLVRESQRRYQQLFEASPIPIMIYDPASLAMLEVNPATLAHYGYTREELLAMSIKDIRPPEDVPAFLAYIEKETLQDERTSTWRHRRKDGSIMQVEVNSHAVTWKDHSARMLLVHDITDLLRIEEELRVQKTHFELLFESAPEGIAMLDGRGNVNDVNRAFAHMFGLSKEEMIGRNIVEMTASQKGKEEARTALETVMGGKNVHLETRRTGREGHPIDVSINAVPVDDGRGTNMAYVLCQDITQKKQGAREREDLIVKLQKALADIKTLGGLLPICAWCKKVRDDSGYYHQIETFIAKHSAAKFTHGICPDCRGKFDRDAGTRTNALRKLPAKPSNTRQTG